MSSPESRPPTDYRRYRRQTDRKLFIAVVLFLLLVGTGLIAIIYRPSAGVLGFFCPTGRGWDHGSVVDTAHAD